MQISVIIPAYNAAKYLNRCIESVANQDLPYDCYEAIVINDGSTDESIEILNTLCEKYSFLKYVDVENAVQVLFSLLSRIYSTIFRSGVCGEVCSLCSCRLQSPASFLY